MSKRKGSRSIDIVQRANTTGEAIPWYRLLAVAIICRAVMDIEELDYYGTNAHTSGHGNVYRAELDAFCRSAWCDTLMCGVTHWDKTSLAGLAKT